MYLFNIAICKSNWRRSISQDKLEVLFLNIEYIEICGLGSDLTVGIV